MSMNSKVPKFLSFHSLVSSKGGTFMRHPVDQWYLHLKKILVMNLISKKPLFVGGFVLCLQCSSKEISFFLLHFCFADVLENRSLGLC